MAVFAYLRVSTSDQTTDQQLTQISHAGYQVAKDRVYVEHAVSGKLPAMQREEFSKLDRLGRDILDVIHTVRTLAGHGVALEVLGLGKLDGGPQASLTLNMLAAISQFEREMISERTKAKLQQLKAEGRKLGRPTKTDDEASIRKAKELMATGSSWRKTAKELGVALSTLQRMLKNA